MKKYVGLRIWKDDETGVEFVARVAFRMEDVSQLEEYKCVVTWKDTREKIYVIVSDTSMILIDNFDSFFDEWNKVTSFYNSPN